MPIVEVEAVCIKMRSDRAPDRVEISAEHQYEAQDYAAQLSEREGRPIQIVGWYHSHPHITVRPSHVGVFGLHAFACWAGCD